MDLGKRISNTSQLGTDDVSSYREAAEIAFGG